MKKSLRFHMMNLLMTIAAVLLIAETLLAKRFSASWDIGILLPAIIGSTFLALTVVRIIRGKPIINQKQSKKVVYLLLLLVCLFFIGTEAVIISDPLLHDAANEERVSTIVVLGCGLTPSGVPSLALDMRLRAAYDYYRENPGTKLIVSGGQGWNEPISEAEAMRRWLAGRDVPAADIIVEDKSTSTMENFQYSAIILEELGLLGQPIAFATNDFHVFRSRFLAKRNGLEAYALSAPTPTVIWLNVHMREFFALYKSLVFDR